ncbi:MAG: hypothetical protein U1F42_00585 [Candidatus Competibacteraceae bacterium]
MKAMLAERWEQWTREWEQRGLERGMQQGLRQGLQEGREEGQRQERLRIAWSLLDVITDDRLLAEKTGLNVADVQRLREEGG